MAKKATAAAPSTKVTKPKALPAGDGVHVVVPSKAVKAPKTAWLVWIGSEHYKGIADWSDEAIALGVSKRLPNAAMAKAITAPGSVVFVAHDEGETEDCKECLAKIDCPVCRKRTTEMATLRSLVDKTINDFKGDFADEAPRGLKRFVEVREAKIAALTKECDGCSTCKGKGKVKAGSGGHVVLKDGRKWDYRTYNYWLHQPGKFDAEDMVLDKEMCEHCGGTGEMPKGRIFGVFIPERVEYILRGDEKPEELEALKDFRLVKSVAGETKRKCGVRRVGGYYAVTSAGTASIPARTTLEALAKAGVVDLASAEIHGSFIRFGESVAIGEKRFRGIKSIDIKKLRLERAADQAEMVKDALA